MKVSKIETALFGENIYILWNEEIREAVVVDPGMMRETEYEHFSDFIEKNALKVTHVLLTHAHIDHACAARWVADKYGVLVEGSEKDAEYAENMAAQVAMFHLNIKVEPLKIDVDLTDGDVIKLGDEEICVLETPGHSLGGLVYYIPSIASAMVGDTIFRYSIGRTDLPGGSFATLEESIKNKVLALPGETTLYPGHGPETTVAEEMMHNPYVTAE